MVEKYLKEFAGTAMRSTSIDENFCNNFKAFLLNTNSRRSKTAKLSQNSAFSYFKIFRLALKQAFKDGILKDDLYSKVKSIPQAETQREFLTQEELQSLVNTDCTIPILKKAAIFSALTGLYISDILKMKWSEIRHSKVNGYYIQFTQQKTKGVEVLYISDQAFSLLGARGKADDLVFDGLKYSAYTNLHLKA